MVAPGRIISEHFNHCSHLDGIRAYEKGHFGVVLEDRLVAAGLAVNIFSEGGVRSLVSEGLVAPCGYDINGQHAYGYAFDRTVDAELAWGEVLEAVD